MNAKKRPVKEKFVKLNIDGENTKIEPNSLIGGTAAGLDMLVISGAKGEITGACQNKCPHIGTPLDQGKVVDGKLVCPLHGSSWDIKTGKVDKWCPSPLLVGPLTGLLKEPSDIKIAQAKKAGNGVQVKVDVNRKLNFEKDYWRGILDSQGKTDGGYY